MPYSFWPDILSLDLLLLLFVETCNITFPSPQNILIFPLGTFNLHCQTMLTLLSLMPKCKYCNIYEWPRTLKETNSLI